MGDLYDIDLGIFGLIFAIAPKKLLKQSIFEKPSLILFFRIMGIVLVIMCIFSLVT